MEKIAVFGTGVVGNIIGKKLIQLGYTVMMGSRTATNEKALTWVDANGKNASAGTLQMLLHLEKLFLIVLKEKLH
jgi:predicted dinucleotide-binding enzyme